MVPADRLVVLPDGIDDQTGAAMMLKGMTAAYLLLRTYKVTPDSTFLFHAAAGGVGLIVCQWARKLGATMIGTVGSPEKAELAKSLGCTPHDQLPRGRLCGARQGADRREGL